MFVIRIYIPLPANIFQGGLAMLNLGGKYLLPGELCASSSRMFYQLSFVSCSTDAPDPSLLNLS